MYGTTYDNITAEQGNGLITDAPRVGGNGAFLGIEFMTNVVMVNGDNNLTEQQLLDLENGGMSRGAVVPTGNIEGQQFGSEGPGAINPNHYTLANPPSGGASHWREQSRRNRVVQYDDSPRKTDIGL